MQDPHNPPLALARGGFHAARHRGIIPGMSERDELAQQQRDSHGPEASREQAVGRVATLILVPSAVAVPLGPAWAVLSGVIAAGHWRWQGSTLLSLVVVVFVAEILWSSWRAQLVDAGWKQWAHIHPLPARGARVPILPYTKPDSPLGRSLYHIGRVRLWIQEVLPAERRGALIATFALPPLILLLSALVSLQMLTLSVAALSIMALEWRAAARKEDHDALRAAVEIGLSWLAGHLVVAQLTPLSLILACCYAIAYQGVLAVERRQEPGSRLGARSFAFLFGGQLVAGLVVLLIGREAPRVGAVAQGFLIIPQLLLLAGAALPSQGRAYAQRVAPFLMLAMFIAAWAA
jgi:hypothetical protein